MLKIQIGDTLVTIEGPSSSPKCRETDLGENPERARSLLVRLAEAVSGARNAYHDISLGMSFNKLVELAEEGRSARINHEGREASHARLQEEYAELREEVRKLLPGHAPVAQTHQGALDAIIEARGIAERYVRLRGEFRRLLNDPQLTHEQMMSVLREDVPPMMRREQRAHAKKNKRKR